MLELIWWLARPSSLLLLFLLLALLTLRARWIGLARLLLGLALLTVALPALLPITELLAAPLEQRVPQPAALPATVDGILVLGGAFEWRISAGRNQLNTNAAGERLMAAAALAQRYPEARLVLTGLFADAVPHDFRAEPDSQSLLFGPAFADRNVIFLGAVRSTYEEALTAIEQLQPQTGETWLLVTSALHMPRALATFATLGWRLEPYPVDYLSSGTLRLEPNLDIARNLSELDRVVREWGALAVYERTGRIER